MNRREFGRLFGLGAAGFARARYGYAQPAPSSSPATSSQALLPGQVLTTDLGGTAWTLRQDDGSESIPAQVPGDNYTDLLRAGKIPDPFYRDNNDQVQWVAQKAWVYERAFDVSAEQLAKKKVELVCHGLDTLATVTLNGVAVGTTDNMFRTWIFDVKKQLKAGATVIEDRPDALIAAAGNVESGGITGTDDRIGDAAARADRQGTRVDQGLAGVIIRGFEVQGARAVLGDSAVARGADDTALNGGAR